MFRLERSSDAERSTIRLIGRVRSEHLGEIKNQLAGCGPKVIVDLEDVTVVDVGVVRFLGQCEREGTGLLHCPPYVREWISREAVQGDEEMRNKRAFGGTDPRGGEGKVMGAPKVAVLRASTASGTEEALRRQYGGKIQLTGSDDAFYERHLIFDNVVDLEATGPRERYEAFARTIRDVLSQRWVRTEQTYQRVNPKRAYYLSMEFLIGRSLSNNITNLLLSPFVSEDVRERALDWVGLLEQEPDAGLGSGGLGRLAACFLDSMATMQLPAMGYGLRYEYGMFRQSIENGWQHEQPDNWLRRPDPWEVARPDERVELKIGCTFELRGGVLQAMNRQPSTLIGIPFDRPVVGYGGKTINTLRLWAAAASDYFDF